MFCSFLCGFQSSTSEAQFEWHITAKENAVEALAGCTGKPYDIVPLRYLQTF